MNEFTRTDGERYAPPPTRGRVLDFYDAMTPSAQYTADQLFESFAQQIPLEVVRKTLAAGCSFGYFTSARTAARTYYRIATLAEYEAKREASKPENRKVTIVQYLWERFNGMFGRTK